MGATKCLCVISAIVLLVSIVVQNYYTIPHELLLGLPYAEVIGNFVHKYLKLFSFENGGQTKVNKGKRRSRIMTPDELKLYDGKPGSKGLYLAVLGQIFDVKRGKKHYGPGGGYDFFAGHDASRAFVSGDFTDDGLIDDVTGLSSQDYLGIDEWIQFYRKDYKYIGKLVGRYYDENGNPTEYNRMVKNWTAEAYAHKDSENKEKEIFPPCNSEWFPETGSRVWCTKQSGGIARDWVGVPRKFFTPGVSQPRCACIKEFGPPSHDPKRPIHNNNGDLDYPNFKEYPNCSKHESSCQIPKDSS